MRQFAIITQADRKLYVCGTDKASVKAGATQAGIAWKDVVPDGYIADPFTDAEEAGKFLRSMTLEITYGYLSLPETATVPHPDCDASYQSLKAATRQVRSSVEMYDLTPRTWDILRKLKSYADLRKKYPHPNPQHQWQFESLLEYTDAIALPGDLE